MSTPVTGHRRALGVSTKAPSKAWGQTGAHLYFIREKGSADFVKIGRADNVEARLAQLQTGNPRRLYVARVIKNAGDFEKVWHAAFLGDRMPGGEWFRLSETLAAAIHAGRLDFPSLTKAARRRARAAADGPKKRVVPRRRLIT